MTLLDKAIVRMLPAVPKPVVQRFSSHYIAGSTLPEAVAVVRGLNEGGEMATIDVLGEEVTCESEARAIAQAYRDVLIAIEREHLDSTVSVKPSETDGLAIDTCLTEVTNVAIASVCPSGDHAQRSTEP